MNKYRRTYNSQGIRTNKPREEISFKEFVSGTTSLIGLVGVLWFLLDIWF